MKEFVQSMQARVEFIKKLPVFLHNTETVAKTVVAFGNSADKKLIIRVSNNKKIIKIERAREILSNMVKKGILEKIGKTKGNYYILKNRLKDL
ncbi:MULTISPECIES: ATP-binding protein [unclassified Nitratiruptor]|uniref:ATP-binding protein n=1 Tax=unclassified Nitratiruptor TaxID=2624044 RepID=UPI001F25F259|nr:MULTISPECIES: ATP-binding protein [unclassified Nitratiruptor]